MAGGRPRLYSDPESFASMAEDYFRLSEERGKMPTLAGISLHLGFDDKESFSHYATYGEEFSRTVKRARMIIEDDRNQRLANPSCTGVIFDLKNNHGWKDVQAVETSGPNGGPIQQAHSIDTASLTDEQLRALASIKV